MKNFEFLTLEKIRVTSHNKITNKKARWGSGLFCFVDEPKS
jgi:hypothetical protein